METTSDNWSLAKKVWFRCCALYFLFYTLTLFFPRIWNPIITFSGSELKIAADRLINSRNGSGDTTYHYVQLACVAMLAIAATMLWTILDRKPKGYHKLSYWLRAWLCFVLAYFLAYYGSAKLVVSQFPFPSFYRLSQPMGTISPMGLAWSFMGYSPAFSAFTGSAEMIGAVLLFFRRTRTFGALFSMAVLSNIVAMNFCYDIPVKLFSSHLLLMAIYIAWPDATRMLHFFFLNKDVPPPAPYPVFSKDWHVARIVFKVIAVLIIALPLASLYTGTDAKAESSKEIKPLQYGTYTVTDFLRNNVAVPPLTTDTVRWHVFVLDKNHMASVRTTSDKTFRCDFRIDTTLKSIYLASGGKDGNTIFSYQVIDSNHLRLAGKIQGDSVRITLKRKDNKDVLLMSRGFHWVNEYPFNR